MFLLLPLQGMNQADKNFGTFFCTDLKLFAYTIGYFSILSHSFIHDIDAIIMAWERNERLAGTLREACFKVVVARYLFN